MLTLFGHLAFQAEGSTQHTHKTPEVSDCFLPHEFCDEAACRRLRRGLCLAASFAFVICLVTHSMLVGALRCCLEFLHWLCLGLCEMQRGSLHDYQAASEVRIWTTSVFLLSRDSVRIPAGFHRDSKAMLRIPGITTSIFCRDSSV